MNEVIGKSKGGLIRSLPCFGPVAFTPKSAATDLRYMRLRLDTEWTVSSKSAILYMSQKLTVFFIRVKPINKGIHTQIYSVTTYLNH